LEAIIETRFLLKQINNFIGFYSNKVIGKFQ